MGTQPLPTKGGGAPLPIFGPFPLWPNGWMHQDATWYRCRPQPRDFVLDGDPGPSPTRGGDATWYGCRPQPRDFVLDGDPVPLPNKGRSPQFSAQVYCSQTAGWIKMPLGTKVGLSPGESVLDGVHGWSPLPNFLPISIVAKRLDASRCHLLWR